MPIPKKITFYGSRSTPPRHAHSGFTNMLSRFVTGARDPGFQRNTWWHTITWTYSFHPAIGERGRKDVYCSVLAVNDGPLLTPW